MSGGTRRRSFHAEPIAPALDPRIYDALSCLHACVLALDAERRRLDTRLEAHRGRGAAVAKGSDLEQRHSELTEELKALWTVIEKLREHADPGGQHL